MIFSSFFFLSFSFSFFFFLGPQYMSGGSLSDLIEDKGLDEATIAYVLHELLEAIDYLHGENKIHRGR